MIHVAVLQLAAAVLTDRTIEHSWGKHYTHCPLHPDGRGGENSGVVQVDDHVSQLPLNLTVVHALTGWRDVWEENNINNQKRSSFTLQATRKGSCWVH